MAMLRTLGVGLCTLLMGSTVIAETLTTEASQTQLTKSALTPTEQTRARQWDLTDAEWQRYRHLMQGIRGSLSASTISPIEVLGIHARDEAERRYYAEKWVIAMQDDTERVLAFQHAYDQAWKRLFPQAQLINPIQLPGASPEVMLEPGDRLMFFTTLDCARCDALLPRLLAKLQKTPGVGLDIYLVESPVDADVEVQTWAQARSIPADLVRKGAITLNHDDGVLARLAGDDSEVPQIIHRRWNRFSPMPLTALRP